MRDPETALVGKIANGPRLPGDLLPQRVKMVIPTRGGEILQDLAAIRQVHEGSSGIILEITIAELNQPRILITAHPPQRFQPPEGAFRRRPVAIVGREKQGRARCANPAGMH